MSSKSPSRAGVALLVTALFAALFGFVPPGALAGGGPFDAFTDPSIDQPRYVTTAADGAVWFTATASDRVGTVRLDGTVVTFADAQVDAPTAITRGPDGALWFISSGNDRIGRITTAGTITTFPATGVADLRGIATGADGNLWFTAEAPAAVARMSPAGVVTTFPTALVADPTEITAGADGNLWFTNTGDDRIGRVTTLGSVTFFGAATVSNPRGITRGPDGNVWLTSADNDRVGRISPAGQITTWPADLDQPSRITAGYDGDDLWMSNTTTGQVRRVSVGGFVSPYVAHGQGLAGIVASSTGHLWMAHRDDDTLIRLPLEAAPGAMGRFVQHVDPDEAIDEPLGLVVHSDGELWFADYGGDQVGRIDPDGGDVDVFTGANVVRPADVVSHPDGSVYFTSSGSNRIGRVTSSGVVTTVSDPQGEVDEPYGITVGSDGKLWFTMISDERIGRYDPATGDITTFPAPGMDVSRDIVSGPGGDLFFTAESDGLLARATTAGVVTVFDDPEGEVSAPYGITVGPDAALWFVNAVSAGGIGRLDPTTGDIQLFHDPFDELESPYDITVGPDDRLWITGAGGQVARMDTSGTTVTFEATYGLTQVPFEIAAGPDGNLWYSAISDPLLVSVTPGPRFGDAGFTHPFYDEIDWMGAEGISTGFAGSPLPTYHPSDAVSRQAMSAFMYRLGGSPPFTPPATATFSDVTTTHPFFAEIEWMAAEGITTGFPGSPKPSYQPGAAVSRQAMSAFMYRLADAPVFVPPPTPTFADVTAGHPFFGEIEWMASEGITTGFAGSPKPSYQPATAVSRQAMSAFMYRLAPLVPDRA